MKLSVHVAIAAAALRRREEYAFRSSLLLREASNGQGHCRPARFRAFLRNAGFRRTRIEEIIGDLVRSGMAARRVNKHGHEVLVPLTIQEMLARYGLPETRWTVSIPLSILKGKALRQNFFTHVEAGLGTDPKARATWTAITGVAKSTQIRAEKRVGAKVRPNVIRAEHNAHDRLLCVEEGRERHRSFRDEHSVYLQIANSVSYPDIPRRKRVVKNHACSPCCDIRAQQPTARRRYFTNAPKAAKQREWRVTTVDGEIVRPVLVEEDAQALGRSDIGVYGVV
jgi:hypothetical protein